MAKVTTYEVMKRPADSSGSYELHLMADESEVFDALDDAYTAAESLEPQFETMIRVTETTIHSYYL